MLRRWPDIETPNGRRAWAFAALFGSALVFTLFIVWGLWHLRNDAEHTFWLAVLAHAQLAMVVSGFVWVLGRRMLASVTRDGATIDDRADASDNTQPEG